MRCSFAGWTLRIVAITFDTVLVLNAAFTIIGVGIGVWGGD
jgi:hypothetical protein